MEDRLWLGRGLMKKERQVKPEHGIIDLLEEALLLRAEGRTQKFRIDELEKGVLAFPVLRQGLLEWTGNIRQIALAGIVQEAGQDHPVGKVPVGGFLCTAQTVLRNGPEGLDVAVAPAQEGEGMGNVLNENGLRIGLQGIKMLSGIGRDSAAHRISFLGKGQMSFCKP